MSGTEKILFVDDESDILGTYGYMLKNLGYRVTTRARSPEALALFKENPDMFDLVITDETMPEMSGRAMASEMLKIRTDIPVIIITGRETDDNVFAETGIRTVIRKPFSRNEISLAIREILDKKPGNRK